MRIFSALLQPSYFEFYQPLHCLTAFYIINMRVCIFVLMGVGLMKIAAVQAAISYGDVDANYHIADQAVEAAAAADAILSCCQSCGIRRFIHQMSMIWPMKREREQRLFFPMRQNGIMFTLLGVL